MLPFTGRSKSGLYQHFRRPELLKLIPLEAKRILDVGCAAGELGRAVKARQKCHYAGIEPNKIAAILAREHLDYVANSTIEAIDLKEIAEGYDCVILADVLEHLVNPLSILNKITKSAADDCTYIASLPNVSHPGIVRELASGLFRYRSAGILDDTHLRFFTPPSMEQLFTSAKLRTEYTAPFPSTEDPQQYLFRLKQIKKESRESALTVIMPTCNTLQITQSSIESLRHARPRDKIIIVLDNGSTDKTLDWLRKQRDILVIACPHNFGFPPAINMLLACVTTPYVLISNSDVVYPKMSIYRMMMKINENEKHMIVGPVGPNVSGPQCCPAANVEEQTQLDAWADRFHENNSRPLVPIHRLVFFSVLISMDVIKKTGYLDERFSPGNFEDDDYCLRMILNGYAPYYDQSIYVHHYGSATFKANNTNYQSLSIRNKKLFLSKWGRSYKDTVTRFYACVGK